MNLLTLFERYHIDKMNPNGYHHLYLKLLEPIKDKVTNVLEVGLGTTDPTLVSNMSFAVKTGYQTGNSLRVWKEFFPNASVYGVDVDEKAIFQEDRITTFACDSMNVSKMQSILDLLDKKFDLIIDDGLHTLEGNLGTLESTLPYLAEDGIYIMEDINQYDDVYIEQLLSNNKFRKLTEGYNLQLHDGFTFGFSRIIVITHDTKDNSSNL